jgi:tetratricopeptide (TPR) repeat protein
MPKSAMSDLNPEFIERYQLLLEEDPKSKVFAPLAEAYRKMGLLKEALQICTQGVQYHPDFSGGRVALARVLIDSGDISTAIEQLQKAVDLAPENVLAQMILGDCLMRMKNPKEALKAYKMVLFLNPRHDRAQRAIRKLESLTADEYDEDIFALRSLHPNTLQEEAALPLEPLPPSRAIRNLDRYVSLADAFLVRNDFDRAQQVLLEAQQNLGPHPEIERRLKLLSLRGSEESSPDIVTPLEAPSVPVPPLNRGERIREAKIQVLQKLLTNIRDRSPK